MSFREEGEILEELIAQEHALSDDLILKVFRYQAQYNPVYSKYLEYLGCNISGIVSITDIPFMPVELFKDHKVLIGEDFELYFESSGTTGSVASKHYVRNKFIYEVHSRKAFEAIYGDIDSYIIFALLPNYIERGNSSLVYMTTSFINSQNHELSGFYLNDFKKLAVELHAAKKSDYKILLIGVSYALLDFFAEYPQSGTDMIIMETGGMKGRKKELTRHELHEELNTISGATQIHSEYGMTELLSQAYSRHGGVFQTSPLMRVLIRDLSDPLSTNMTGTGGINVIDLANLYSCSFLAISDLGTVHPDGTFDVLGRIDQSDIRGCSLMY